MRAYVPVGWDGLAVLQAAGELPGPVSAFAVDPAWRADTPEVDEEEWEYEAQQLAAADLPEGGGVVLAVDTEPPVAARVGEAGFADGRVELPAGVRRRDVAAVLGADLAWYGVQEIPMLLEAR